MSSRNDGFPIGIAILVFIGAAVMYQIWKASASVGLPFSVGASIFGWSCFAALGLAVIHFSLGLARLAWPIALGIVFMSFWPAIRIWGDKSPPSFAGFEVSELAWWAESYTLWPALIALVAIGYISNKWFD